MRKHDTHNSRLLGSMIGPKLFCESVGPQHKIISLLAPRLEFYLQLGLTTLQLHLLACTVCCNLSHMMALHMTLHRHVEQPASVASPADIHPCVQTTLLQCLTTTVRHSAVVVSIGGSPR